MVVNLALALVGYAFFSCVEDEEDNPPSQIQSTPYKY